MAMRLASVSLRGQVLGLGPSKFKQTLRAPQVMAQATMSTSSLGAKQIVEIVAQKAGVSKETAKSVLDAFTDTVVNAVAKGERPPRRAPP